MINKIIYGGNVLIDLTGDNITPDKLASGIKAHDASGAPIVGTNTYDADTPDELDRMEAERNKPTQEERITQLEATTDDIILMMADLIGGN